VLCRRWKKASKVEGTLTYIGYAIFVVKWVVVLVLYRIGKTSKDLWGWSCDDRAKRIQQYYVDDLDFDKLCVEQVNAGTHGLWCLLLTGHRLFPGT